jgi:hypothetical protein
MVNHELEQDTQSTSGTSLKDQVGLVDTIARATSSDAMGQADARNVCVPNDAVDSWSGLQLLSQMVSMSHLFTLSLDSAY